MKFFTTLTLLMTLLLTTNGYSKGEAAVVDEFYVGEETIYNSDMSKVIAKKQTLNHTAYDKVNNVIHDNAYFPQENRAFKAKYRFNPESINMPSEAEIESSIPGLIGESRFYGKRWSWYGFTAKFHIPQRGTLNVLGHYKPNGGYFLVKETYSLAGDLITISETEYIKISKKSFDQFMNK